MVPPGEDDEEEPLSGEGSPPKGKAAAPERAGSQPAGKIKARRGVVWSDDDD